MTPSSSPTTSVEESPGLTFVARTHARRPLYTSAAGKTLLANVPDEEMYRLLDLAGPDQAGEVRQFLAELPEIRSRRLAFNRGATFADAFAVATPLLAPDGRLIAAISAAVDASEADRLDDVGEELKKAVATLGPQLRAPTALSRLDTVVWLRQSRLLLRENLPRQRVVATAMAMARDLARPRGPGRKRASATYAARRAAIRTAPDSSRWSRI